jgi:ribosomal-protein-alanine N-acetyltransferase
LHVDHCQVHDPSSVAQHPQDVAARELRALLAAPAALQERGAGAGVPGGEPVHRAPPCQTRCGPADDGTMRLTDGTVTLRMHEPGDVDDLVRMGSDPATACWTTAPQPYERRHAERWVSEQAPGMWRAGSGFSWAFEASDGAGPRFAGNLDIRRGAVPDIGYATAPWARGRGLTARAVRLATAWAFDRGLPVVHWAAHVGNLPSWRVAHADGWFASLRPGDEPGPRTTWWPVPELVGERVRLRAHTDADVPRIVEACTDPRSRYWLTGLPDPYTGDTARRFTTACRLAESLGQKVTWAVADRSDDRLLANVGLFGLDAPLNPTAGEIGYWAHPDARGRGVVSEAVGLAVAHAFRTRADGGLRQDGVQGDGVLGDGAWYERLVTG